MRRTGYDRFALPSNPFQDLASESLEEHEVFHVTQEADEDFERMKQDVLDGLSKAFVLLAGPAGAGKTQRLRVTYAQAQQAEAFAVFLNLGESPPEPLAAIASAVVAAVTKRKLARRLGARGVARLKSLAKGKAASPETAGRTLAEALGALAPAYVLLNDLDALHGPPRIALLDTLLSAVSNMPVGVMVCMTTQPSHVAQFARENEALASRLNRLVALRGLSNQEAELLLAKRMAGKRLVEDLDPLFPFTAPAIAELNGAAGGAPRRLLQLADIVLDGAVKERAFQVGPELVNAILARALDAPLLAQPAAAEPQVPPPGTSAVDPPSGPPPAAASAQPSLAGSKVAAAPRTPDQSIRKALWGRRGAR